MAEDKTYNTVSEEINENTTERRVAEQDKQLASLGLRVEAKRDIGIIGIIATGWNISNSWAGIAAGMAISVSASGTVGIIYGIFFIFIMVGCSAATLAEIAAVYPTAGAQYHWTSILAPRRLSRGLSYSCGAINVLGWITLSVGTSIVFPQFVNALIVANNPSYQPKAWQTFLMYQAFNLVIFLYNVFGLKKTMWIHNVGFIITTVSFFVILITCVARAPVRQENKFVWANWINETGWDSNVIAFLTSLVNANYIYGGIDGALHLAEEAKNAATAVPLALLSTITIGLATALAFAVAMLYSVSDFDAVRNTPTQLPIYEIWRQATRSQEVAVFFTFLLLLTAVFANIGNLQTASRLTWAFGRDDAIFMSNRIGHINQKLEVPMWALIVNSVIIAVLGCVYLASTTAFAAMVGTGLVMQQLSFAFPAAILLMRGRSNKVLPPDRLVRLGVFGWISNFVTVAFAIIVLVFYDFPFKRPVETGNMNYTCVVLGLMGILGLINWVFYARKHYHGPRLHD